MYKMLKLMNTTRRLMDEVKDTSPDLVLLNVRFRAIMGIMEERDNIQIWTDEEGNQRIVLLYINYCGLRPRDERNCGNMAKIQ